MAKASKVSDTMIIVLPSLNKKGYVFEAFAKSSGAGYTDNHGRVLVGTGHRDTYDQADRAARRELAVFLKMQAKRAKR